MALEINTNKAPGTLLTANKDGIDIACAQGVLRLTQVQRDGSRVMSAVDYLNARTLHLE